jgi:transcriptional regulator CtsR
MATQEDFYQQLTSNCGKKVLTKKEQEIMRIATLKDICGINCPNSKAKIRNRLMKKLLEKQNK